jgi:hypothetical protein
VKLPVGFTVRVMLVWLVKVPDEPVIVRVTEPMAAVALEVTVNVLVLAVLLGLNDAATPFARPDTDRLTFPEKLFTGLTVIVIEPLAPCVMVKLVGEAERVKLGCGEEADNQLLTRLAALTVPIPVAKSQPVVVP